MAVKVSEVTDYIDENVLHSKLYDGSDDTTKKKAVNNAINTLDMHLSDVYKSRDSIPLEDVAEQTLWILRLDDSMLRAEMGTNMISVDGMQIQLSEMDRTISPNILKRHGIKNIRKTRVGGYADSVNESFRKGHEYKPSHYHRYVGRY